MLIVEDGTGLSDANTYITIDEAKAYAGARGVSFDDDSAVSKNLVLAADYMETTGPYKGCKFKDGQGLQFPRAERIGGPSLGIPEEVKKAQAQLLLDIQESGALMTTNQAFALKRRKLEGLEQEYAVGSYAVYAPKASHKFYDFLMTEYKQYSGGAWLIR